MAPGLIEGRCPSYYVTRTGRRITEPDTDQAGSAAVIRTVSRYTDGAQIDRPQPCVSIGWAGGPERARALAELLDRRGYQPPEQPMTRAEFDALPAETRDSVLAPAIWSVLGEGIPAGMAIERHGLRPSASRRLRRMIKALGWD